MKRLSAQSFIKRASFGLLISAALMAASVMILLVSFNKAATSLAASPSFLYWSAATIFVVSLAASAAIFRVFQKNVQRILLENAELKQAANILEQTEASFQNLIENANDPIYTIDLQGNCTYLNKAGENLVGYSREEFCHLNIADLVAPEHLDLARRMVALKLETKTPVIYELELIAKNKRRIVVELSTKAICKSGEPIGMQGIVHDITARRQAENQLRENLSLLASTFEATADGILVVDRANRIVSCNSRYLSITKMPKELIETGDNARMMGFALDRLADPEDFLKRTRVLTDQPENQSYDTVEFEDGRIYERSSHPQILDGEVIGRVVSFRDITERQLVENTLRQSEANLAAAQRITHLGSWEVDLRNLQNVNDNEVRWSDEVYRIFGYEPKQMEVSIERFFDSIHRKDASRVRRTFFSTVARRKNLDIEYRVVLPNGGERIHHGQAEIICDEQTKQPLKLIGTVQDITKRRRAEEALRQSEEKYRTILEIIEEGYYEVDLEGNFTFFNDALANAIKYDKEEIIGLNFRQYLSQQTADELVGVCRRVSATRQPVTNLEYEILCKDGTRMFVESSVAIVLNQENEPVGFRGIIRDVTTRKQAEYALRESESKFRTLIESTNEGLLQVDADDRTLFVNNRLCEMVGYSSEELMSANWMKLLLDEEGRILVRQANERRRRGISDGYEVCLGKKSGEILWANVSGAPITDSAGKICGSLGVFTDITQKKRVEEQLLHDAFHDNLTGLANRALFMDHLRMAIERGRSRHSNLYAVLFLDFDRFKVINDSLGHAEGDNLLKQIARRLETATRTGDLVARLGGDEFVVLLSEMLDQSDAVQIAERIQNNLKTPFELSEREVFVSASIGIALSTAGHTRAEDMLRDADIAMYRAKAKGRARYQVFDEAMHQQAATQLEIETELRQALERGEFVLHYQSIVNLETNRLAGFETLVRWIHPQRGMIPPKDFISAAEETNLILPLGRWILEESCRQMRRWQRRNPLANDLKVSVNLSSRQFLQTDLAEQIAATLAATELAPHCLKVEITESYLMENSESAIEIMKRLREIGVEISLDDFGTGYSSLSYLHRLPVDYIKIDRSFVSRMIENKENFEIVFTIIKLAQNLKKKVIAEGIETIEQLNHLKNLRCEFGQGYYFSEPLAASAAEKIIGEDARGFSLSVDQTDFDFDLLVQ